MRLSLDALETLDAIAEQGSFAAAAEVLHRVPSAVTYTVRKLESDLGVALFDRSGRRPVLTPAGQTLLERGRELLRQAESLENRVKQAAHGWETQLSIAVDELVPVSLLFPLIAEFDSMICGTRLRLSTEILGGAWDALADRRADLSVAAPGEVPPGLGLSTERIGYMHFVFVCAPFHPLAEAAEPIPGSVLQHYRAVVVADSSRRLTPRSAGVETGQDTLVMSSLSAKLQAQIAGLGVGFLPAYLAAPDIAAGRLVVRQVQNARDPIPLHLAWRSGEDGRALRWFRQRLLDHAALQRLLTPDHTTAGVNS
ncbi:LysR family transcriptional regulator [Sinimarinibacterium sp. CAU 1509]|uniref:LysR family transcriptional regulator n=1 Tax=Sinimarinibacterium sp. CAU 1509 TaxID=2562283 RepID=UPI0010ABC1FB|nr:LysR family transcriptional regulator [Sinimarinibacterium sp. CAU 1509]TJY59947.1 LysR family transcriptional regulator [Sinimarinibacterium sp. CAU 1509]